MQVRHTNPYNVENKAYTGVIDCIRQTIKGFFCFFLFFFQRICSGQGFFGLWRGNLAAVLRHGPQQVYSVKNVIYCYGGVKIGSKFWV